MRTLRLITMTLATLAILLSATPAHAGCGCNKPPPVAASIRPAFASPGDSVTLFSPQIVAGRSYTVRFTDGERSYEVSTVGVLKRDLADGVVKPQVVVAAPKGIPGPMRVRLKRGDTTLVSVDESNFTILQPALALAQGDGETLAQCYRAAVGEDGTLYIPLDISNVVEHEIFAGLFEGYPLLFGPQDVVIYNRQGFLMQLLGPNEAGIFAITDPAGALNSLQLTYDRHEFVTYREQHAHVDGFGLDPADRAWHSDGTRHIDHDHLVLAVRGVVETTNQAPREGQTPAFDFRITTALGDTTGASVTTRTIAWGSCWN